MPNLCTNKPNNRSTLLQKRPGKHSPQRGGVNCKGQRLRVEKMANIRHGVGRECLLGFSGEP